MQAFIDKWNKRVGGAERSNAALYLTEMLTALELPTPDPAGAWSLENDYVFERAVRSSIDEGGHPNRIDLYKRGCFVLEAKQSRWNGQAKSAPFDPVELAADAASGPSTSAGRRWDTLMRNARKQAQSYVSQLPADHATPPFILVCDVARGFEIWADFTGTGRGYVQFPDRQRFRFSHSDLATPEIQTLVRTIWTDPWSLDPSRKAAEITRGIIDELAVVSRRLEANGYDAEEVAHFLMRCIFTIFAADVGLLPKGRLVALIEDCIRSPVQFVPMVSNLWKCLDQPVREDRYFAGFGAYVPHINGGLFSKREALPLGADELTHLLRATRHDWRRVEPAIFGALLEHALRPEDRRRLGAHYTPRRYVESVVEKTVMEPLWADCAGVSLKIERARDDGKTTDAIGLADLTLTGLYNLLEAVRVGEILTARQQDTARRARVVILRELHDEIDRLTAGAYHWPADQTEAQTIAALVSLNRVRDVEEARGQVRWLRPDFQIGRIGGGARGPADLVLPSEPQPAPTGRRPSFPQDRYEQPLVIQASLARDRRPVGSHELARRFSGGARLTPRIDRVLTTLHRYGHVERLSDGRWISAQG